MPQHWRGLWARAQPGGGSSEPAQPPAGHPGCAAAAQNPPHPGAKHLTRQERWQNLAGSLAAHSLSGGRYLLVDDVMTTGASSILASQVLLEAGAERVDVAVLARTPQNRPLTEPL